MIVELTGAPPSAPFDLVFGGDVVLRGPAAGRLSERLAGVLGAATTVVNLEAPLVARPAPEPKAGPHLDLPLEAAGELRGLGIAAVGLANNHAWDHGAEGLRSTIDACRGAGLEVVGAGGDLAEALSPLSLEAGGARVALLAAAEAEFGLAGADRAGVAPISALELLGAIATVRASHDFVVVLTHGGVEEVPVSPPQRAAQLRSLIDAGADLVVGSHPHTIQGWERHGEGVAFHSLGDLLVDAPTRGLLLGVSLGVRRVDVLVVQQRDGVLDFAPVDGVAELADAVGDAGLWQELAARVFADRYLPLLRRIGEPQAPASGGAPGIRTVRDALGRMRADAAPARPPEPWEALHLLNHFRCESQRWTIETALELQGGLAEDLRTPETARRADELLGAAGYRSPS